MLTVLEQFNLQVVALLDIADLHKEKQDHIFVSSCPVVGSQVIAYGFVRDIDFYQGLEVILPVSFDKAALKNVNCIAVCDEVLFSMTAVLKAD